MFIMSECYLTCDFLLSFFQLLHSLALCLWAHILLSVCIGGCLSSNCLSLSPLTDRCVCRWTVYEPRLSLSFWCFILFVMPPLPSFVTFRYGREVWCGMHSMHDVFMPVWRLFCVSVCGKFSLEPFMLCAILLYMWLFICTMLCMDHLAFFKL